MEFARALAARGYDLALIARRRDRLYRLAEELETRHAANAEVIAADLSRKDQLDFVAEKVAGEKRLELLVNNAGFGLLGAFHETTLSEQLNMYWVHVLAAVELTHTVLPGMIARHRGGVINVASVAGFAHMPGHASYGSTKAWMIAFTECLYLELKSIGSSVRVQALCPGYTYTEFHDVLRLDRKVVMPVRGLWMTADFVVSESLRGFDKGKWLVIPGWYYRLLVAFLKIFPRRLLHATVTRIATRRRETAIGKP